MPAASISLSLALEQLRERLVHEPDAVLERGLLMLVAATSARSRSSRIGSSSFTSRSFASVTYSSRSRVARLRKLSKSAAARFQRSIASSRSAARAAMVLAALVDLLVSCDLRLVRHYDVFASSSTTSYSPSSTTSSSGVVAPLPPPDACCCAVACA